MTYFDPKNIETRFRSLKEQVLLLAAVHSMLAIIATIVAFGGSNPVALTIPLAAAFGAAAIFSLTIMPSVRRGEPKSRRPLLILCCLTLPVFPVSLFAVGILLLLLTGPQPHLLTPAFKRQFMANRPPDRTSFATWFCLAAIAFIFLAVWIISQLPPEFRRPK